LLSSCVVGVVVGGGSGTDIEANTVFLHVSVLPNLRFLIPLNAALSFRSVTPVSLSTVSSARIFFLPLRLRCRPSLVRENRNPPL